MRIDFHPDATTELEASVAWYSEHSPSASRNLVVAIDVALASIAQDPARFFHIDDLHQACSVVKFPFQIVYRHVPNRILVVAVAHAKRRPGYWHDR